MVRRRGGCAKGTGPGGSKKVAEDTVFRCLFAYVLTWGMLGGALMAVRCMSTAHPARTAYATTIEALKRKVDAMPWRGMVPTGRLNFNHAGAVGSFFAVVLLNGGLYFFDLPFIPMGGLLKDHLPQLGLHAFRGPQ